MLTHPECPDEGTLRDLLVGQVSDADAVGLEAHLARCPRCLEVVRGLRPEDTLLEALRLGAGLAAAIQAGTKEEQIASLRALPGRVTVSPEPPPDNEKFEFLAPAERPDELGRLGHYRVLRVLGRGGMGIVFQAEDQQLGRPVALKVMKPALAALAANRGRFLREARAMAAVKSDHVVTVYQVGEGRDVPYLAMELLQGEPMDRWLERGGTPTAAELPRLGREMALGLAAAHERGLVHRDVKPANVWLEAPHGRVKLLDFGLARAAEEDTHLTATGAVVGTPAYMAPEQARGEKLDGRADLFSLGVVLYRLCTGRLPFQGDTTMAVLTSLAECTPTPVRELAPAVPPPLADLVMGLLRKNPDERPHGAKEVAAALEAVERGASHSHPARRRSRGRLLAAVALVALLAPSVWLVATRKGEEGGPIEKDKPFVVVRQQGERRGFDTLADALADRGPGTAVEVHGDGPFAVPPLRIGGSGLVLKAAPGCRPVFVAQVEEGTRLPWLAVLGGEVLVEGCDFHGDTPLPTWFFDGGPEPRPAAPWTFRNCRFWVNGPRGLIRNAGPALRLEDCLVASSYTEALLSLGRRTDLEMVNNVVVPIGPTTVAAAGDQTLRLTDNTFVVETLLRPPLDEAPERPVTVVAEGNVFRGERLLGDKGTDMPSEKVARAQVKWQGKNNLYSRGSMQTYVSFGREKRELKTLADWNQFWGRVEPGSVEVGWVAFRSSEWGKDTASSLRFVREEVERLCGPLKERLPQVGPDWGLVGPEPARPETRRGPPPGGPFVLLRGEEAPRGHATLQAALDASRDGDAIEVRGDGPFQGASVKQPARGGRLPLRAAPGYRPVFLETNFRLELPKAEVEIEGLTLEESHLAGDFARLTLRNCALRATKEFWTLTCGARGVGQSLRFHNCLFNVGPSCSAGPGQSVLLDNCVVSRTSLDPRADDDCEMVLRRCACLTNGSAGGVACDRRPWATRQRVRAEGSVFVGGAALTNSAARVRWDGSGNVYALTAGFIYGQPIYSLDAWRKRWGGDRDSLALPSPYLQPRWWRFQPGQPKRPDGKDFGADVSRLPTNPPTR
jgi:hypothetical protein